MFSMVQHNALRCSTVCRTLQYSSVQCSAAMYAVMCAVKCTLQSSTVQCAVRCSLVAIQCHTIQYSVQYSRVQCAVQYSTVYYGAVICAVQHTLQSSTIGCNKVYSSQNSAHCRNLWPEQHFSTTSL